MKIFILSLTMMFQIGCATGNLQERVNETWRGSSKQEVINQYGPPEHIFKDSLGNESFSYDEHGPMDSMKFIFTFDSNDTVTFVRLKRHIEDRGQIERARAYDRQMREAGERAARGANPPF